MSKNDLFNSFIALAEEKYTDVEFEHLLEKVYSEALTQTEQQAYIQLLDFARSLQRQDSGYEFVYRHLLNLYVLNGSRIKPLNNISRWLRGLGTGYVPLLLISGVSGIGKTSLAMAFELRVQQMGAVFVVGHSLEQEDMSFALWRNITHALESATGVSRSDLLAPIGQGSAAKSFQSLVQETGDWLSQCARSQPLVIFLDDLHWADADSLELLNSLTNNGIESPILFLATYRSEEIKRGNALYEYLPKLHRNRPIERIHLDALSHDDINRLFTAYHGMCSSQLQAYLHEHAEGHPLFTVELLNNLITNDLLIEDENGYWLPPKESVPVPKILSQLIGQRVRQLGDLCEELLSLAAVEGEIWHLQIIEQLLDASEDDLLEGLEAALHAEVISVEDNAAETYRFSHGLIRQVLYEGQIARRRKRLHARIAEQFESQLPSSVYAIAYHYFEAERWDKAIHFSTLAAEQATSNFATKSAIQLYQQVLSAAEKMQGDVDPKILINTHERLGHIYLSLEQRKDAIDAFNQMLTAAKASSDLVAQGHALSWLAHVYTASYELDRAETCITEAYQIAQQTEDTDLLARTLLHLGKVKSPKGGNLEEVEKYFKKSVYFAEMLSDKTILTEALRYLIYPILWTGRYEEAESYARRTLELALKTDDIRLLSNAHQTLSSVLTELGQYVEAQQLIQTILDFGETNNIHIPRSSRLINMMGYVYLEAGNPEKALIWDKRAVESIKHTGDLIYYEVERYSLLNVATDLIHLNRIDEAVAHIKRFEAITEAADFVRFRYYNRYLLLMSELKIAQGDYNLAIYYAHDARTFAQEYDNRKNIAKSHWFEGQALAGLRRFDEAIQQLTQAIEIADQIKHGSLRWKIRVSLATTFNKVGKSSENIVHEARVLMDQIHQRLAQSALEQSFLASDWVAQLERLEQDPTLEKATYPAGLTNREVEVLQLITQGATNQDIADTLHIGIRTVHTHVRNILNKTNSDNRTAAAAFAIEHNIAST